MPTPFPFHPLPVALLLALTATSCQSQALPESASKAAQANATATATPEIGQEQRNLVQRQHLEMTRMQLIDDRCQWLDATSRVALDASAAERKAWLEDTGTAPIRDAAALADNRKQADDTDCANKTDRYAVQYGAWQMRITWTLRAQALLDGGARPAWMAGRSPTAEFRPALEQALTALNEKYGSSIAQSQPGIEQQAAQLLTQVCPGEPKQCPAPAAPERGKAYARAWVEQATRFAAALARDPVKLPEPPQEP